VFTDLIRLEECGGLDLLLIKSELILKVWLPLWLKYFIYIFGDNFIDILSIDH